MAEAGARHQWEISKEYELIGWAYANLADVMHQTGIHGGCSTLLISSTGAFSVAWSILSGFLQVPIHGFVKTKTFSKTECNAAEVAKEEDEKGYYRDVEIYGYMRLRAEPDLIPDATPSGPELIGEVAAAPGGQRQL